MSAVLAGTMLSLVGGGVVPAVAGARGTPKTPKCAPGSVDDTEGVVSTIDSTIGKEMKAVEKAIKKTKLNPGETRIKESTTSTGLIIKTTLARSADDDTYTFELDLVHAGPTPTFVVITTGSRTDAVTVSGVHTTDKQISVDYDALRSFVPDSKATGNFDATIVNLKDPSKPAPGRQDTLSVTFTNIRVKMNDKHGPRTGSHTHVGEPGIGGSLDFHASIPVPCPAGPASGPVDITVQRKHVDDATGERTFRRDAVVTGGSLGAGEQAIAFACGTNPPMGAGMKSSYALHKRENADGSTASFRITLKNETEPFCNPDFGALVSPTDNATDWAFPHP